MRQHVGHTQKSESSRALPFSVIALTDSCVSVIFPQPPHNFVNSTSRICGEPYLTGSHCAEFRIQPVQLFVSRTKFHFYPYRLLFDIPRSFHNSVFFSAFSKSFIDHLQELTRKNPNSFISLSLSL